MANNFYKCSECISTHQNASKCMQNELCKCFVHKIIKEVDFITFKWAKIDELLVSLCDGRPCIHPKYRKVANRVPTRIESPLEYNPQKQ